MAITIKIALAINTQTMQITQGTKGQDPKMVHQSTKNPKPKGVLGLHMRKHRETGQGAQKLRAQTRICT